jgi:hypothetical protein
MTVTVFTCDGSALPFACTVTVPKQGRCRDLINALSCACSLKNSEELKLAEVMTLTVVTHVHKLMDMQFLGLTYLNMLFTGTEPFISKVSRRPLNIPLHD